jgi:glycine dehydrogenase subunit 2
MTALNRAGWRPEMRRRAAPTTRADLHRQPRADARRSADLRDRRQRPTGVDFDEPRRPPTLARSRGPRRSACRAQRAETVRHYTRLSRQNYAIDLGLFPLGSCTMKHNPRLNEKIARMPGFADVHPLQPAETVQGAYAVIHELAANG